MVRDYETIRRDGATLRGRLYAPETGRGPLAVYSHGFGGTLLDLEHHGPGFAEAGVACLFIDFYGGGPRSLSGGDMLDMSVYTERDDLLWVLDHLPEPYGGAEVFLVGESQGGLVSLLAANRAPERVRGLALWYPAFVIPDDARKRCPDGVPREARLFGLPIGVEYNRAALAMNLEGEQAMCACPVLMIHGDRDDLVPVAYSRRALERFPRAELVEIPGAGHGFEYPDNDRARELTIRFIRKHS